MVWWGMLLTKWEAGTSPSKADKQSHMPRSAMPKQAARAAAKQRKQAASALVCTCQHAGEASQSGGSVAGWLAAYRQWDSVASKGYVSLPVSSNV